MTIQGMADVTQDGKITYHPKDTDVVQVDKELFESLVNDKLAVKRIRELHKPISCDCSSDTCQGFCDECSGELGNGVEYPCPTIKALDGEQDV